MNIQPITSVKAPVFTGKVITNKTYVTKPMKSDSFESSKENFDLDKSMKILSDVRLENGKKKFERNQLIKIENSLKGEPKKWDSVSKLANNPNIKGDFVYLMASKPLEHLNTLTQIAEIKDEKGSHKYSGKEMMQFTDKLMPEDLKKSLPLTKTKLSVKNIVLLTQTPNIPNLDKVSEKVLEMEKVAGKDLKEVSFARNRYEKDAYDLTAKLQGDNEKKVVLNKDLKREALEDTTSFTNKNGKKYFVKKSTDFRNNTVSKVTLREDKEVGRPVFENEVRIVKDKNNKVKYYEYTSHSQVNGVYDIVRKTPEGKQKVLSSGKIDKKTGIVSIQKDMTSPEGVRTQYLYENDPQGNRIIDYKITDEKGKTLLNYSQSFEVVDDNHFISSKNGKVYEMTVSEDKNTLTVKDRDTKQENKLNLNKMVKGNRKSMLNLLKKFPGEELINLKDTTNILKGVDKLEDCCYWPDKKEIDIVDDFYSVLHELGHSKDNKNGNSVLTRTEDIQKVYDKERAAFNKAFPNAQRDHINYFIDVEEHYSGSRGGLEETVAESNALLNSYNTQNDIAARSQYLQQYFPKTIAKMSEYLFK